MGSIMEVFPHGANLVPQARTWRSASARAVEPQRSRLARLDDLASIRALHHAVQAAAPSVALRQFEARRRAFPEGQLVVERGGELVACASALIVRWDDPTPSTFDTHDPAGHTLLLDDIAFDPETSGDAALRRLLQAERRVCRALNLRRIILAARIPGYSAFEDELSPEDYAGRVVWGDIAEAALRVPLALGFQYCGIARGWRPRDTGSCGHPGLLPRPNPPFSPPHPPPPKPPPKCASLLRYPRRTPPFVAPGLATHLRLFP